MNPQIIVLLQRIRGDLRALLEKQKKEVKPVCEEEKTKQRSAEWPPSALQVKVESLEEAIEQYNTGRHTSRRLQWGTFWLTVGTFIALCVAAAFTYEQWQTMDKTYTEVQTQTVIFHKQLASTQGAVLRIEPRLWPLEGKNGQVSLLVTNDGHVVSGKVTGEISVNRVNIPDNSTIPNSQTNFPVDIPYVAIGPTRGPPPVIIPIFGFLPHDGILYRDTKIAFRIDIRLQYDDGFGDPIPETGCDYGYNIAPDGTTNANGSLMTCDSIERLDFILKEKQRQQPQPSH